MKRRPLLGALALLTVAALFSVISAASAAATMTFVSNIHGFTTVGGTWNDGAVGGLSGSRATGSGYYVSTDDVEASLTIEATMTVSTGSAGQAMLIFRADETGSSGYAVVLDHGANQARLIDLQSGATIGFAFSTTIALGTGYAVKVVTDGPAIQVYLGSSLAVTATDAAYTHGVVALGVRNGASLFQNVNLYEFRTPLSGWTSTAGSWSHIAEGILGNPGAAPSAAFIASQAAADFTYSATFEAITSGTTASLLFRMNTAGTSGYAFQVDVDHNSVALVNLSTNTTLATGTATSSPGGVALFHVYALRVTVKGTNVDAYFGVQDNPPVVSSNSLSAGSGQFGLRTAGGQTVFQNAQTDVGFRTSLASLAPLSGTWTSGQDGLTGAAGSGLHVGDVARSQGSDFVFQADVTVPATGGVASLTFRSNAAATTGYLVDFDPNLHRVALRNASAGTIATGAMSGVMASTSRVKVVAVGSSIKVYVDGYATPAIDVTDSAANSGYFGLAVYSGAATFQNVTATAERDYYAEQLRPQYHYTAPTGTADDEQLIYYGGEYHLFHQQNGQWAHAVSTDLVHWQSLGIAIGYGRHAQSWAGSVVVDPNNTSGLFGGMNSGLIAYYTNFDVVTKKQSVSISHSTDAGRHWLEGPSLTGLAVGDPNDHLTDFRDPKVFWNSQAGVWNMVIAIVDAGIPKVAIYQSTNLLAWIYKSAFNGTSLTGAVWENPDLFPLAVDGNSTNQKWVLINGVGDDATTHRSEVQYWIGAFDGSNFTAASPTTSAALRLDFGKDFYAGQTVAEPGGQRVLMGRMANVDYSSAIPTSPWLSSAAFPRDLALKTVPGVGVRLTQAPVGQLSTIEGSPQTWSNATVATTGNVLSGVLGTTYRFDGTFDLTGSATTEFGLDVRTGNGERTRIGYDVAGGNLFVDRTVAGYSGFTVGFADRENAPLAPASGNTVTFSVLVDESSVEVFAGQGSTVFSTLVLPTSTSNGMDLYAVGGSVNATAIAVTPIHSIWRDEVTTGTTPDRVDTSADQVNVATGATTTLTGAIEPFTASQSLTCSSSDASIATVTASCTSGATVSGVSAGRAIITVASAGTPTVTSTVPVYVTSLDTNLTFTGAPTNTAWTVTQNGLTGRFDTNTAINVASQTGTDFTYEGLLRVEPSMPFSWPSLVFRSNVAGTSGYAVGIDANGNVVRLYRLPISAASAAVSPLAKANVPVLTGRAYDIKVVTTGWRIQVYVNGALQIDYTDNDPAQRSGSGHYGVLMWNGQGSFQSLRVS
ncbi:glycoside hydrolase family 32 protein [Glaciihabitans sp. INWT7]|uniref:glycoside hydrolase family 32 protein n=1 Tax=Glaciihabitans sp. INWT7 TaxID=2596912 RepID=UPI001627C10A|nr:glycoside hydrolase family 32 protein [Glaciihabitans sp. INWT7]QNE46177.1 glycoside hydrolase family 32 protein [Glaciihabitans sp. INWT7]